MAGGVDMTVGAPLGRKTRLVITPERIEWGEQGVTLAQVRHVACHTSTMTSYGVRMSSQIRCWFADDRGEISVLVGAGRTRSQEARLAEACAGLQATIFETLVPRLVDAAVAKLRGGDAVAIGGRQVIKPSVGGEGSGLGGMVRNNIRGRKASTVEVTPAGLELKGGKGTKTSWPWPAITGASFRDGRVELSAAGKTTPLLPLTYQDAVLLPRLVEAVQGSARRS